MVLGGREQVVQEVIMGSEDVKMLTLGGGAKNHHMGERRIFEANVKSPWAPRRRRWLRQNPNRQGREESGFSLIRNTQ